MILSLEWVRENIAEFGGDNNSITIMGDGSGAQMASLLTLIPRGIDSLFSRSIQLDGTAFVPATLQSLKPAYAQLAQDFGCLNDDSTDLSVMSCMNTVEATKLQEAYGREYVKIKPKTCWINGN